MSRDVTAGKIIIFPLSHRLFSYHVEDWCSSQFVHRLGYNKRGEDAAIDRCITAMVHPFFPSMSVGEKKMEMSGGGGVC
jgi:hypothetical protein